MMNNESTSNDSTTTDQLPCSDKMVFDSKNEAQAAGTAAEWQYGGALKAYKCHHCHLWHLASA